MIQIILGIIFSILIIFLEPLIYIPFGLSIFIIFSTILYSIRLNNGNILLIIISSLLLDLTVKNDLGSYLLVFSLIVLINQIGKRITSDGSILSMILKMLSIYFSLVLLNIVYIDGYTNQLLVENILPSVITFILITVIQSIFNNFNSDSNLTQIKL